MSHDLLTGRTPYHYKGAAEPHITRYTYPIGDRYLVRVVRDNKRIERRFAHLSDAREFRDRVLKSAAPSKRGHPAKKHLLAAVKAYKAKRCPASMGWIKLAIRALVPAAHDPIEYITNTRKPRPHGALAFLIKSFVKLAHKQL